MQKGQFCFSFTSCYDFRHSFIEVVVLWIDGPWVRKFRSTARHMYNRWMWVALLLVVKEAYLWYSEAPLRVTKRNRELPPVADSGFSSLYMYSQAPLTKSAFCNSLLSIRPYTCANRTQLWFQPSSDREGFGFVRISNAINQFSDKFNFANLPHRLISVTQN